MPDPEPTHEARPARRRRRAVGPPGSRPGAEPDLDVGRQRVERPADDDERLLREIPPHHG